MRNHLARQCASMGVALFKPSFEYFVALLVQLAEEPFTVTEAGCQER